MDIFAKLTQIRKEKKIKQGEMANHLGIDQSTLCRYEKGKRYIPFFMVEKYAEYLEYELKILVT